MEYLFIYLLQLTDIFEATTTVFTVLFFVGLCVLAVVSILWLVVNGDSSIYDEERKDATTILLNTAKVVSIIGIITFCISLLPTKQTALLIGGTYVAKRTINSSIVNDKLKAVNEIIDIQLNKYLKELKGEN